MKQNKEENIEINKDFHVDKPELIKPTHQEHVYHKEIATLGLRRKFVRHELFGEYINPSKEADYPANVAPEFKVTVRIAGNETTITAPADTSLLRSLEANGIAAPAHCRRDIWQDPVPEEIKMRYLQEYSAGFQR